MNESILWNEGWSFAKKELGCGYEKAMAEGNFQSVDIPHDWMIYNTNDLYENSEGWYRKTFKVTEYELSGRVCVRFGAVYMDSTVYVNGKEAFTWKYGYSTFEIDITEFLKVGENEIVVGVVYQNPNTRWYSGAGIFRDVYLKHLDNVHIASDGIYIRPRKNNDDSWTLKYSTEINHLGDWVAGCEIRATLLYKGAMVAMSCENTECTKGITVVENQLSVDKPFIWDIDEPNLYLFNVQLSVDGKCVHSQTQKIGFREVEYSPERGFILNGRKVRINGVCEHHDLGCLGAAFNKNAFRRKLEKLRKMGVNGIRTSHNMPAKEVMELADELGFVVVSESFDMWEKPKTEFDYGRFFVDWAGKDVRSWVRRDRNHPSLIMWSIGNEIYDTHCDEHGQEITRRLMDYVREYDYDGNAPCTIGSNYMPWENAQKCADIVKMAGYNYAEKYYAEHHEKYPDWVIYGSETSSTVQSRGVYKFPYEKQILCDDDEQCSSLGNCTTSWGAKSTEYCITMDRDAEYSMGQFIWTGFDYIGEPTPYQTKNSYFGQLDTAGFEKDTFYIYQAEWTDYKKAPMVHVFPYWDFNEGQIIDVRVASNAPKVELFLNEKSLGVYDIDHKHGKQLLAHFKVPYEKGCLKAVAYDEMGNVIATDEKKSFTDAVKLVLTPENTSIKADGRDLIFLQISAIDKDGNPVWNANNRVNVNVNGAGRLVGLDNGDSTDYDQYKSTSRRLFSGKLLAVIAAKKEAGQINVEVSSVGMPTESITFEAVECELTAGVCANEENTKCANANNVDDNEIPVRNIFLTASGDKKLGPDNREVKVKAELVPANATYNDLVWSVINDAGVETNVAELCGEGNEVTLKALGDGNIFVRCAAKNGDSKVRIISQIEFSIEGLGMANINPYEFVAGSLFTASDIEPAVGLERGIVTKREGKSYIAYDKVDFGKNGSDEFTMPVYELENKPFPIEVWKGIPGAEGSELMDTVIYDLPSKWATYQEKTFKLKKRFKGVCTISFVADHAINIKGFEFKKYEKAYDTNYAVDNDTLYGDTYTITVDAITGIGNNVSVVFNDMDFAKGVSKLTICGRSPLAKNTIHVRFAGEDGSINQLAEFVMPEGAGEEYVEQTFELESVSGLKTVNFVFLPGCQFDFKWFRFE